MSCAWRRQGWRPGALLAPLALAAALLSAEGGLATCAWLFAFALCLDRGAWRDRLLSLLPAAAVVVAWRAVYQLQGFGASGGSFYVDPVREPLAFVEALLLRLPLLVVGLWALPPSDAAGVLDPAAVAVLRGVGVALIAGLVVLLAPLLRALPAARFYAVGMVLSLVPLAAVQPGDRLLVFAGFGAMGLLALLLGDWRRQGAAAPLVRRLATGIPRGPVGRGPPGSSRWPRRRRAIRVRDAPRGRGARVAALGTWRLHRLSPTSRR